MQKILFSNARSSSLEEIATPRSGSWVQLVEPDDIEIEDFAEKYKLNPDLLKDGIDLYESPRIERDEGNIYVFVRYYHANKQTINATEPLLIVFTPTQLITIARTENMVLNRLSLPNSGIVTTQKTKIMLQILAAVNESYLSYVTTVTRKILRVRSELRDTRISDQTLFDFVVLEDDLNEFLSALQPQAAVLRLLLTGKYVRLFEEDKDLVEDISLSATEIIELVKSRLKTIITIRESYDAIAASELNRTFKRLTSISIFLMVPTLISGIYGMNVDLPFDDNTAAFNFIALFIVTVTILAVLYFRKKRWL